MTNFETFIRVNVLKKKDIAEYLGVTNAFITQLCDGSKKLPAQKLALIKANPNNWDISMLIEDRSVSGTGNIVIDGQNRIENSSIHQDNRHYYSDSPDVLRAQIDLLDERIKEKDAQIKEKDAQIKQLLDILQGVKK